MATIQFEISDDILGQLESLFGRDVSQQLGVAAFREWSNWLLGRDRPQTIPAIETQRAITLYTDVFPDDLPSMPHLASILQLPPARCRYIIQSIRYLEPQLLRKRWLNAAREAYTRITSVAEPYILDVDLDCREVIDEVLRDIQSANDNLADFDRPRRRGNILRYELVQGYYDRIQDALTTALDRLGERGHK